MKKFNYKAKTQEGKTVKGQVEAQDDKQALTLLRERGLVPFSLDPVREGIFTYVSAKLLKRISLSDLANFTQQLSQMIGSGLTVNESLAILVEQSPPSLKLVLEDILRSVEGGSSLAKALEKHPKVFSKVYVSLVRAGETAGVLDGVLKRLAGNLEKQREFMGKVKGAMVYPIIIIVGMGVVGAVMMIFVMPKLFALYKEFDAELPATTQLLISISSFLARFWWLCLLALAGLIALLKNYKKTAAGRMQFDILILRIPLIGNIKTQIVLTEMTRTLGLLVGAGISVVEALNIAAEASGNALYEKHLKEASKQIEKGLSLASTLEPYEEFPPVVSHMISVGEETGKVDEILAKLSQFFETQSDEMVKGLTTAIEPLIMIILGVGVGFLIISVIMPIYNLTSQF